MKSVKELERAAMEIRIWLLRLCNREIIHIGGDFSIADVMTVLWQYQMHYNANNITDEERDRFVLSKGHASAVLSFNQAMVGCFPAEEVLWEYAADNGRFSMHSCNLVNPYIEVSTGSLGHGMPVACGIAAALRLKGNYKSRVYTIMGDGEQSEGSVWEAAANAFHYKLGNLISIVDANGLEADGRTDTITGLGDIAQKYRAFGWNAIDINGHDVQEIVNAFDSLPAADTDIPTCILAHTVKGKGISFMEDQMRWHTGKITDEQLNSCISELRNAYERKWGK